jgi:hypothetical protein
VETEFYGFLTNLLNAPTMVGLGLLMLAAYFWFTKITSERTVGSEFKELIGQLQSQITELHDQLKEERVARAEAEKEKYDAIAQVGQLSAEIELGRCLIHTQFCGGGFPSSCVQGDVFRGYVYHPRIVVDHGDSSSCTDYGCRNASANRCLGHGRLLLLFYGFKPVCVNSVNTEG